MRLLRSLGAVLLASMVLISCNRDPQVAKKRYLESGDKYAAKGRYKEASIQYRNALKIDPKYGEAHYKLGIAYMQPPSPDLVHAVQSYRRAVELLDDNQPDHWNAMVKLTEIYLSPAVAKDDTIMAEVRGNTDALLKHDPNSFDGHRLTGDMKMLQAIDAGRQKRTTESRDLLDAAMKEYGIALNVRPDDRGVNMQVARGLVLQGDGPGAEKRFRAMIEKDPQYVDAYRELYVLLLTQNRRAEAEELLKTAYQRNPKEYQFPLGLAAQYAAEKRHDQMVSVLNQLKSKSAEYKTVYLDIGDFYANIGDGDSAVREFKEGLDKDSSRKTTYQKRIVDILLRQGKRAEAADMNSQILKDHPDDYEAKGVAAGMLLDKGEVAKASSELQQVVTHVPENAMARYNLGRAFALQGDFEQARQQFQKAIDLRPNYMQARTALAQLQVGRGDYDGALRTAQDASRLDPSNPNLRLIESAALMGQRKYADSRQVLNALLTTNPGSGDALFQLGVVSMAERKYKDAEDAFRRASQANASDKRPVMGLVENYMAQNRPQDAVQYLQGELAKKPNDMDLRMALGNVNVRMGQRDAAIQEYRKALSAAQQGSKSEGEAHYRLGETYRLGGDLNSAINEFQAARKTLPDDQRVLSALGMSLAAANRWPEARQVYESVVKADPNNGVVLNNLAFGIAEHEGDLDQALTLAQKAKQLMPNQPEVSDTIGWIYLKKKLPDNAISIFQELVAKQPNQPTFQLHLGQAYAQKGDRTKAQSALRKALELNPSPEEKRQIQQAMAGGA